MTELERKLAEMWRKRKHILRVMAIASVSMAIVQAAERDWPTVLYCLMVSHIFWTEGTIIDGPR